MLEYWNKKKDIFAKGYTPNMSEESFLIKNVKMWAYVINDLNDEKVVWTIYEKQLQTNKPRRI